MSHFLFIISNNVVVKSVQAMAFRPVSSLLIVVQARARMSNVIDDIIKYAEAFQPKEFSKVVAACVTHMDTAITWTETQFRAALAEQTGMAKVVFTRLDKPFLQLENEVLGVCSPQPVNLSINSDNFLRFFKINDRNYKILQTIQREVLRFESIKSKFYAANEIFWQPEAFNLHQIDPFKVDLLFEFQVGIWTVVIFMCYADVFVIVVTVVTSPTAYVISMDLVGPSNCDLVELMLLKRNPRLSCFRPSPLGRKAWMTESIVSAQKRVSEANNFQFMGPNMANEAGHIANMTNQLKNVLWEVRTRCLHFTSNHGVNELRKCPYCGEVWALVDGCTGGTTCGNMANGFGERKRSSGVMATFTFVWDELHEVLSIMRSGQRQMRDNGAQGWRKKGCGASITWSAMAVVPLPAEFRVTQVVSVDDIPTLPEKAAASWKRSFEEEKAKYKIKEGQPSAEQESRADDMDKYASDFQALNV